MGWFGNDKEQDSRLDALEGHVRLLTDAVQQNQLDVAASQIAILGIQAEIEAAVGVLQERLEQKVSVGDVDPVLAQLNTDLGLARERLEESSQAAEDTWFALQGGLQDAFTTLRKSVEEASESAKKI